MRRVARVFDWVAVGATRVLLSLVVVLVLAPAVLTVVLSFSNDPSISFPPKTWGVERYLDLFSSAQWLQALALSLQVSVVTAIVALVIGTGVLLAIHRSRLPFRAALESVSLIPLILPIAAYAVAVYLVFMELDLIGNFAGLVIVNVALALPFVILVGGVALREASQDIELVAYTLGAPRARVLLGTTLRMAAPALFVGFAMAFQISFEEAVVVNFVGGPELSTLPRAISDSVRYGSDPVITAIASTIVLITTIGIAIPLALRRGSNK